MSNALVRFALTALIVAMVMGQCFAETEEPLGAPRLFWRNGDTLDGTIISANEEELSWSSKAFAKPLRLRLDAVHMIRFPTVPQDPESELDNFQAQTIQTQEGNRFFGIVQSSTDDHLVVETYQHGKVKIRRDAVSLIANPVKRAHVYSGPKGLRGWSTVTYGRKLSEWEELPGGRLTTKMVAAELYRSLPANGSVDIDVELMWRNNPSFQIRFLTPYGKTTKETVKLETRAANYVVQTLGSNGRFRQLDTIPKGVTKCRFLLRWNQSASELVVYFGRRYLGKISVDRQNTLGTAGIYIKNTGPQLTLSRLEIRARSKLDINLTDPTKDTILRADNQSIAGRVTSIMKDKVTFVDAEENTTDLLWSDIPEISFRQPAGRSDPQPDGVECIFHNGETLEGRLLYSDASGLAIKVPAMDESIRCQFDALERIIVNPKSLPPVITAPRLIAGNVAIHGQMAPTKTGHVGWLPVGGVESVRTAEHAPVRFELGSIESAGSAQDDVVFLRSGDVIPCKVRTATAAQLTISSVFAEDRVLPATVVKAVELSASPVKPIKGFDRHWQVADRGKAILDENSLTFKQPTVARHPHILQGCDQIEFVVSRKQIQKQGSFLQVTMHDEDEQERTIPFYFSEDQSFVMGHRGNAFQSISEKAGDFSVTIQMRHPFSISVNGVVVNRREGTSGIAPRIVSWLNLSFNLTRGQPFRVQRFPPPANGDAVLTISDLVVSQTRRTPISHTTAALDSTPLLTVPRDRKSDSVTHFAIGTNNDIVRGRLVKLDAEAVQMQSKSVTLNIPRDTLSGLIWLENNDDEAKTTSLARIVLRDTTTFGLEQPTLTEHHLEGQHPQLGRCKIAVDDIHMVLWGSTPNQIHDHDFLKWTATDAQRPVFTDEDGGHQIESRLVGKVLELDAELIGSPKRFRLSEHVGRIVVIDFWASWCAPCIRNMPKLIETMQAYSPDEVSFVAINQGESALVVATMLAAKGWDMPTGLDPNSDASRTFRIEAVPQTVVVDRQGKIAAVFVGATPDLHIELKATIDRLLEE